jgi:hypothetical protein
LYVSIKSSFVARVPERSKYCRLPGNALPEV